MEDLHISNTSHDQGYSNNSDVCENSGIYKKYIQFSGSTYVALITVTCFGLLVTLLAIFAVFSLTKRDQAAPVYIINLLFSDLIQLCSMITLITAPTKRSCEIIMHTYLLGIMASIGFMVCVSLERYLVLAKPLWYRFRRNIKTAVALCAGVWVVVLVLRLIVYLVGFESGRIITAVFLLLPFPFFVFFLAGTLKALSTAIKVPADEKRRIVAVLVVVLLIYTLLFLPIIVFCLVKEARDNINFSHAALTCSIISPLADSSIYILLRKSAIDRVLVSMSCKIFNNQQMISTSTASKSISFSENV